MKAPKISERLLLFFMKRAVIGPKSFLQPNKTEEIQGAVHLERLRQAKTAVGMDKKFILVQIRVTLFPAYVWKVLSHQTKSAIIPEYKKFFLFYGLISSYPKMREIFFEKV